MKRLIHILVMGVLFMPGCMPAFALDIHDLEIMTEEYPPYNFMEKASIRGIATDILVEMLERMNVRITRKDLQLMPWARAYRDVLRKPGTMLYSMTRTPLREESFRWVGPIMKVRIGLLAGKNSGIVIRSAEELSKYYIGVVRNDVGNQLLLSLGVPEKRLDYAPTVWQNMQKLQMGRIQLFAFDLAVAGYAAAHLAFADDAFVPVYILQESHIYYAFHRDTPDRIIERFQEAFDTLKRPGADGAGEYDRIVERYLKPQDIIR